MYSVELSPAAVRDYKKIPESQIQVINSAIDNLHTDPRPHGYKKLKNRNAYRIRVGNYRIIYEVHKKILVVIVIRIRHRREVYRDL